MSLRPLALLLCGALLVAPVALAVPSILEPAPAANACTIQGGTAGTCFFTCPRGKPVNVTILGLANVAVRADCLNWSQVVSASCAFVVTCSATSPQVSIMTGNGRCTASADVVILSATCEAV